MRFIAPPRVAFRRFLVASLAVCGMALVVSCGDDSSDKSPVQAVEESSSSEFERSSSSIQNVTPVSSEAIRSSSSICEDCDESSSSVTPQSSSSETSVSSSSAKSSSSSAKVEDSSSSAKVDESSSSMKAAESSSSVKVEESSSSEKNEVSSSSEKPVESSSSEKVEESSSSEKPVESSSSAMSIYDAENNTLTDLRDNQIYKTVTIGEQIWMAENLNYMPEDTVGTIYSGGTVCGGGAQNSKEDSEKCDIFGRLYLRKVALNKTTASNRQGICPDGWSIPKKEDWEKLISHLGENVVLKIKGDSWESTPGTNESGFSAIPAGNYNNSVIGYDNLSRAYFFYWNSKSDPYFLRIRDEENDLYYSYGATYMMYSVRCIKE
ncbi:major paralogous domain-containing protein [Fibrobacter sp. UWB15]|nr:uncharacterized protein (TIGR02145 family) [Fibrobacter sp. UWB6]SHF84097.1 major paralogous domain-containing protein [Fibrobacter sp. UWB8]SMG17154.1 major paralogous domain-containing protein [Fibrobacter sp. UWB15]